MLGHVGIGARQQQAEIGEVRARSPDLLPVDPPPIAPLPLFTLGAGAQAGEIRTAGRLGKKLTPDFVAMHGRGDKAIHDFLRCVMDQGRQAHAHADREGIVGHVEAGFLGAEDDILDRRTAPPAPFGWPGHRSIARLGLGALPGLRLRQALGIASLELRTGRGGTARANPFRKPGADFLAKGGFLRGIVEIHGDPLHA